MPLEHQDLVLSPEALGGGGRWSTYSMQTLSQAAQQPWVRTGTWSMTSSPEGLLELPEGTRCHLPQRTFRWLPTC